MYKIKESEIKGKIQELQHNIIKFLDEYLSGKQVIAKPKVYEDKVNAQITFEDIIIVIDIEIGEFMSDILMEAYLGSNSPDYENISLRIHIHNIPNEEMQSINIINAFKEIYPKFEKLIKFNNITLEVSNDKH